ncbi:hypothetical protein BC829DRAFT_417275 [Chytridium lagenaria]|nr:hypothetical protein BC829DRAFT_417275 [Chytridium lagenaria]
MRPYHPSPPIDSANTAANRVLTDDFEAEIEAWKSLRIVQRRPKTKVAVGVNRELFRRFDADVLEADIDDPEFYVEKIDNHTFHKERMSYEYHIKWLGQGTSHNLWLEEVEIPALLVQDYWNQMATKDPHEYRDRLRFTSKKGIPKRTKTIPGYTVAADNDGYESDHGENRVHDLPPPVVTTPADVPLALEDFMDNDSENISSP